MFASLGLVRQEAVFRQQYLPPAPQLPPWSQQLGLWQQPSWRYAQEMVTQANHAEATIAS